MMPVTTRATTAEFRYRFWIIALIFWAGFSCYTFDHVSTVHALSRWLSLHSGLAPAHAIRLVSAGAAAIALLAALVRTWASAYLRSDVVHDDTLHSDRLVADGPFRYVRNPLYLGNILLGIAFGVMASRLGFAVIVGGLLLFTLRLIAREEVELISSQGEGYQRYLATVPKLLPALSPRVPAGSTPARWTQAFIGELFLWCFAAALVVFALSLNVTLFYGCVVAAFVARIFARVVESRQRRSAVGA